MADPQAEREARYAEAILTVLARSLTGTRIEIARAVIALADQEQAELQERLRAVEALADDERLPHWVRGVIRATLASPVEADTEGG